MEECSNFVGNVLVQVRHVFLLDYHLVLSLPFFFLKEIVLVQVRRVFLLDYHLVLSLPFFFKEIFNL